MSKYGPVPKAVLTATDKMRPNQRNPEDTCGRPALTNSHPVMFVGDFGAPAGWPAQSPAKATFTPGLPGEGKTSKKRDTGESTIQPGIRRP
jgi:hypothetical protein